MTSTPRRATSFFNRLVLHPCAMGALTALSYNRELRLPEAGRDPTAAQRIRTYKLLRQASGALGDLARGPAHKGSIVDCWELREPTGKLKGEYTTPDHWLRTEGREGGGRRAVIGDQ